MAIDIARDHVLQEAEGLLRFREGQPRLLEDLYRAHRAAIERIVRFGFVGTSGARISGAVGRPHELADLVQEVFARAFAPRARHSYDGLRPYRCYLFAIARHVLVDWHRRARREIPTDADVLERALEASGRAGARGSDPSAAQHVLGTLPPELARLYHARVIGGCSQRDAAAVLGLSRQNVRTLDQRLRARLSPS